MLRRWKRFLIEKHKERKKVVMGTFFNSDSPLMRALSRIADLIILNLLTLLCCLPIITAGASLTACHYMALKMVRGEESYVIKGFFKSFKQNLKQGTIIWLLLLGLIAILVGDLMILNKIELQYNMLLRVLILAVGIIVLFVTTFIFPTLAKFDNTVMRTIKNAFVISVLQLPKTIIMILLNAAPIVMLLVIPLAPFSFLFGFSAPAYVSAFLYNKFFKKLENQVLEKNGDVLGDEDVNNEERIFFDAPVENEE